MMKNRTREVATSFRFSKPQQKAWKKACDLFVYFYAVPTRFIELASAVLCLLGFLSVYISILFEPKGTNLCVSSLT